MGLTPKGPRPLPSPFPLIPGAPKARHGSAQPRLLRACAILLWESVWLGVLNRSKRSGETAQMSRCDADSVSIGASWTAEFCGAGLLCPTGIVGRQTRSEEHTSELQSLMRNSYAGFCLKKKKIKSIRRI